MTTEDDPSISEEEIEMLMEGLGEWPDRRMSQGKVKYLRENYSDIEKNFYYPGPFTDVSPIFALESVDEFIYQDRGGDWGWNNNPVDESFIRIFDTLEEEGKAEDFYVEDRGNGFAKFQIKVENKRGDYSPREIKVYHGDVKGDIYSFTPPEVQNAGIVFSRGLSIPIRCVPAVDKGTLFDGTPTFGQPFRYDLPPSIKLRNFGLKKVGDYRDEKVEHLDIKEIEERKEKAWRRHEELELERGKKFTKELIGEYLPRFSEMVEEHAIEVEGNEILVYDNEAESRVYDLLYEIGGEVSDGITDGFPQQILPCKVNFTHGKEQEIIIEELCRRYRKQRSGWRSVIPFL